MTLLTDYPNCLSENSLGTPPSPEAILQKRVRYSKLLSPFSEAECSTVPCQKMNPFSVSALCSSVCPPAVRWLVAERIVKAIKRVLWGWGRSHILIETLERLLPRDADRDALAAVSRVTGGLRIEATLQHSEPDFVLASSGHPVSTSYPFGGLSGVAATTLRLSASERLGVRHGLCTAVAKTEPLRSPGLVVTEPEYEQTRKALPGQVFSEGRQLGRVLSRPGLVLTGAPAEFARLGRVGLEGYSALLTDSGNAPHDTLSRHHGSLQVRGARPRCCATNVGASLRQFYHMLNAEVVE